MRKLIMILALCLGMYGISQAQDGGGRMNMTPEERATKQAQRMTQALQLTADQKQQVYDLALQTAKQMEAARSSGDRSAMKAMRDQNDAKMKSILTADQYTKFEQIKAERMGRMKDRQQQQQTGE